MTFIRSLAKHDDGKILVEADECTEKCESVPHYEVYVFRHSDGMVMEVVKCAKTTWRKAFKRAVQELGR